MLCYCAVKLLVALVSQIFPDFQFGWLAEEMRRNLPLELDFIHEGHNCEKVSKCFAHLHFLKALYRDHLCCKCFSDTVPVSFVFLYVKFFLCSFIFMFSIQQ